MRLSAAANGSTKVFLYISYSEKNRRKKLWMVVRISIIFASDEILEKFGLSMLILTTVMRKKQQHKPPTLLRTEELLTLNSTKHCLNTKLKEKEIVGFC